MRSLLATVLPSLAALALLSCRTSTPDTDINHGVKYLAVFSGANLVAPDEEKRFNTAFTSRYRSRVVMLRPVVGQAYLTQNASRASLFALIRLTAEREARSVARDLEVALGGQLTALWPIVEGPGSQDNFSGVNFYLALEKRQAPFVRLALASKAEIFKNESEDFGKDRNLLSYFSAAMLSDTPYHSVHILGFSGIAESQYETADGHYHRSVRKLEAADTVLVEKIR